jgi:hypothetical protein
MDEVLARRSIVVAYFDDMTPCTYFDRWQDRLTAVGWLAPGRAYQKGEVSEEFFSALVMMLKKPWQPFVAAGYEPCRFCRFSRGTAKLRYLDTEISIGSNNLFVPDDRQVFVAPSMIAHYIDSHEYQPPLEFQSAVVRSSRLSSMEYYKKMKDNGVWKSQ